MSITLTGAPPSSSHPTADDTNSTSIRDRDTPAASARRFTSASTSSGRRNSTRVPTRGRPITGPAFSGTSPLVAPGESAGGPVCAGGAGFLVAAGGVSGLVTT